MPFDEISYSVGLCNNFNVFLFGKCIVKSYSVAGRCCVYNVHDRTLSRYVVEGHMQYFTFQAFRAKHPGAVVTVDYSAQNDDQSGYCLLSILFSCCPKVNRNVVWHPVK